MVMRIEKIRITAGLGLFERGFRISEQRLGTRAVVGNNATPVLAARR
jgi:hypothetical protein